MFSIRLGWHVICTYDTAGGLCLEKRGEDGRGTSLFFEKKNIYIYIYNNKELHIEDGYSTYIYYVCAGYIPWTGSPCFLSVIVRLRRNRRNTFILIVYIVDYIVVELRVHTFSQSTL